MFTKPRLIHRRGTRAAQPAANAIGVGDGTLYYVTDESVLERSNGTIWQSFSAAVVTGGITQLTGDVTAGPGSGTQPATLSTTGVSAASYGSATQVGTFTVDAKGRLTAAGNTSITGLLSGLTTTRIPYATGATTLGDSANLVWDNGTPALSLFTTHTLLQEALTGGFPSAASFELLVKNDLASGNTFSIRNTNVSGLSAWTARTADGHEVLAMGYGNPSALPTIFTDANYIQSWSGVSTAADPKRLVITMDGNYGGIGSGFRFYVRQSFETDGSIKFWQLIPHTSTQQEVVWIDGVNARMLIGYNAGNGPEQTLHLVSGAIIHDSFGVNAATHLGRNAGGTVSSPSQTGANQLIFQHVVRAYTNAGAYSGNAAAINIFSNEAFTATAQGTRMEFRVTATGAAATTLVYTVQATDLRLGSGIFLRFNGAAATDVMLKRSTVVLQTRLGDDSAFAQHSALEFMNNRANFVMRTAVAWNNGAGALTGTLTNAPATGNPTKWIPFDDNGTTRYVPAW